jgi:4-carboxymuconolactone decarboxylase
MFMMYAMVRLTAQLVASCLLLGSFAEAQQPLPDPRVALRETVKRETLDPETQLLYDSVVNSVTPYPRGLPTPLGVWLHSPAMAAHALPLYMHLRFGGDAVDAIHFTVRQVELAILVAAHEIKSERQWSAHESTARMVGLEQEIIDVVKSDKGVDGLGEKEAAIVRFGRELFRERRISATTFAGAQKLFGTEGVADLAGLLAFHQFIELASYATFDIPAAGDPAAKTLVPLR